MHHVLHLVIQKLPLALRRMGSLTPPAVNDGAPAPGSRDLLLQELEDAQPNPLLLNLATGFPSALLCVLAAGVLAGALAGRQVGGALPGGAPVSTAQSTQPSPLAPPVAALQGRQAQLQALELQALLDLQRHRPPPPVGTAQPR